MPQSSCIKFEKGIYPEATNQGVGGSNPSGRTMHQGPAMLSRALFILRAACLLLTLLTRESINSQSSSGESL